MSVTVSFTVRGDDYKEIHQRIMDKAVAFFGLLSKKELRRLRYSYTAREQGLRSSAGNDVTIGWEADVEAWITTAGEESS